MKNRSDLKSDQNNRNLVAMIIIVRENNLRFVYTTVVLPDEHVEVDYVSLVTKEGLGRWRVREDVVLEAQKDSTTFQLPALVER